MQGDVKRELKGDSIESANFLLTWIIDSIPDMASSDNQDWLMLRHPGILDKIMLIVALKSLESLDSCRRVCKTWNARIMNKIWENPTKKWGTIIQKRLERSWGNLIRKSDNDHCYYLTSNVLPSDDKIIHAILLGKHRNIRIICKISFIICFRNQRHH